MVFNQEEHAVTVSCIIMCYKVQLHLHVHVHVLAKGCVLIRVQAVGAYTWEGGGVGLCLHACVYVGLECVCSACVCTHACMHVCVHVYV